ncbi:ABC transporter permease [Pseudothermotoga thermarum]|uniref:Inner-membrane translocator n=1 Tax=Pseudothermotoga thermarum DSM 5069 TaxID=688269 RepID=F7YUZ6_9THEM|nr:ABC transporter permease [Pseudothermotoga thermarum]AEH50280.1 inner-membrane translocator [Pseudothermotoga thermarum DSM 5069]
MMELLKMTFTASVPIVLAGLGGLFTNVTNTLNIGLEGLMLLSAFLTLLFAQNTSSLLVGILLSCLVCVGFSLLMIFLHLKLKTNLFVVGLATNLMAAGLTVFLAAQIFGTKGTIFFEKLPDVPTLKLKGIPILEFFDGFGVFEAAAVLCTIMCWIILKKTNFGYRMKVVGKGFELARRFGINPESNLIWVYTICGILCALAGASLSLPIKAFVTGMTNGRGWISLVAVIIAKDSAWKLFVAAVVFGFASALTNFLQVLSHLPQEFLLSFPFFFTLLVLIIYSKGSGSK